MSTRYAWADNKLKLQRAIEKTNGEKLSLVEKEARVKQLYVSMGGRVVELPDDNQDNNMSDEEIVGGAEIGAAEVEPTPADIAKVEEVKVEEETSTDTEFSDTTLDTPVTPEEVI